MSPRKKPPPGVGDNPFAWPVQHPDNTPEPPAISEGEKGDMLTFMSDLSKSVDKEKIDHLFNQIFDMNMSRFGFCTNCNKKVQVELPDFRSQMDAVERWANMARGKPPQRPGEEAGVTLIVERVSLNGTADQESV